MALAKSALAKNVRAFERGYEAALVPLFFHEGFERDGRVLRKTIDVGVLSIFVVRNGPRIDIALGLNDELAVTGRSISNLGYERFELPSTPKALAKTLSELTTKLRKKWVPAIRRASKLRRPDLSRIDRALVTRS